MPTEAGDIQSRLLLWSQRPGRGLARVEYSSEVVRQRVVDDLRQALAALGIPFHEIALPFERPLAEVIPLLLDKLAETSSGVVSIAGLGTAFSKDVPLFEPLQVLNFNRERIAAFPLRQIWWMPPALVQNIVHSMPDLNSWFSPRLYLNPEDDRQRAQRLWERFQTAQAKGISKRELLENYALPAIEALREAGALQESETLREKIRDLMPQKDFFISYNQADRAWAEWLAWTLEKEGYTTVLQDWDFRPGSDFIIEMQRATVEAERTLAVLSPNYLSGLYTQPEWSAAFRQDPTGSEQKLIFVRVQDCKPAGMLASRIYIDLVAQEEGAARQILLAGLMRQRAKPTEAPDFPGVATAIHTLAKPATFPGHADSSDGQQSSRSVRFIAALATALTSGRNIEPFRFASVPDFPFVGIWQSTLEFNAIALIDVDTLSDEKIVHLHDSFSAFIDQQAFSFKRQGLLCYVSSKGLNRRDVAFLKSQKRDSDSSVIVSWAIDLLARHIDTNDNPVRAFPPVIILPEFIRPNLAYIQRFLNSWS